MKEIKKNIKASQIFASKEGQITGVKDPEIQWRRAAGEKGLKCVADDNSGGSSREREREKAGKGGGGGRRGGEKGRREGGNCWRGLKITYREKN